MNPVQAIGRGVRHNLRYFLDLFGLFTLTLKETRHLLKPQRLRIFLFLFKRQLFNTGIKAVYINCAIAVFVGVIFAARVLLYIPQASQYAEFFVIVVIREMGPLISGIILIARSATAITAEIGHLKLYDQFEVLAAQGVSPLFIFLLPVFYSFPISLLLMFVYFAGVTMLSAWGYIALFGHSSISLLEFSSAIMDKITLLEVVINTAKAMIGGSLIGIICIYFATQVEDRFTDISRAISNSTTSLLVSYFMLNVVLSILAY